MARKKVLDYDATFPRKLRQLIDERNDVTQEKLAMAIGVTRQTIGNWCSGESVPDALRLVTIADYFEVPIDWLLRENVPRTMDATIASVCKLTGLSESAVQLLCFQFNPESPEYEENSKKWAEYRRILSMFLEHYYFLNPVDDGFFQRVINAKNYYKMVLADIDSSERTPEQSRQVYDYLEQKDIQILLLQKELERWIETTIIHRDMCDKLKQYEDSLTKNVLEYMRRL